MGSLVIFCQVMTELIAWFYTFQVLYQIWACDNGASLYDLFGVAFLSPLLIVLSPLSCPEL